MRRLEIDVVGLINTNLIRTKTTWTLSLITALIGFGLDASIRRNRHDQGQHVSEKFITHTNCWFKVCRSFINLFTFKLSPSRSNLCTPSKLRIVIASHNDQAVCNS